MSFAYGVNVIREPPVRPCRYTCGESPTESNVRPSGEIEATISYQQSLRAIQARRETRTVVHGDVQFQSADLANPCRRPVHALRPSHIDVVELDRAVVVAHRYAWFGTALV